MSFALWLVLIGRNTSRSWHKRNAATFSKQLTTSDEAFTQWYIMVNYDEIQEWVNQLKAGKEVEKDSSENDSQ